MDPFTLAGLGFTAVTVGSLLALHLRRVVVPRMGLWTDPPPVIVHPALGKAFQVDLREAMAFWGRHGYDFDGLYESAAAPVYGIFVDVPNQGEVLEEGFGGIAQRRGKRIADGVVLLEQVRIALDPGLDADERLRCLRHELGHALGFEHAYAGLDRRGKVRGHPTGHVMHPRLEHCGDGLRGVPRG